MPNPIKIHLRSTYSERNIAPEEPRVTPIAVINATYALAFP